VCGICGFLGAPDRDVLRRMRDTLAHRGPDEAGEFVDDGVSLGHRRLSIVDLKSGQQPMRSADGSVVVVFNGEIYNHPQLKRELEGAGRSYRSSSDTESILNAYLEHGTDCLRHLHGMFAFVLYDTKRKRLFGARDRFGKKPFYFSRPRTAGRAGRSFVFASEVRALLEHPDVRRETALSQTGIRRYLSHDYLPGEHTIFANVWKLAAGQAFTIDLNVPDDLEPKLWKYWQNAIESPPTLKLTERDAAVRLMELLAQAVERRLMSDVPLGIFLSGGVDSSVVAALLARSMDPGRINTFSIGFEEKSFDESPFAAAVARHLGTKHRNRTFSAADCRAEIAAVTEHMDEPFADPSILPVSMLSRFARESVTVALGGDGGDELLAGYDPILALGPARLYDALVPAPVHRLVRGAALKLLPASAENMGLSFRAERFTRGAKLASALRLPTWMGAFSALQLRSLLPEAAGRDDPFDEEVAYHARVIAGDGDEIRAGIAYFQRFYLTDDILVKADRASMMHSLEVRAPFLDTAVADFLNALPTALKLRAGTRKYLLKHALTDLPEWRGGLPEAIVRRKKKGFGIPVAHWIRADLRDAFRATLVDDWPSVLGMFDRREIERLLSAHVAGAGNYYKELWALFVLAKWARRWAS
jgi:asparagine synthase (glutamine-hydrolysing)